MTNRDNICWNWSSFELELILSVDNIKKKDSTEICSTLDEVHCLRDLEKGKQFLAEVIK